MHALRAPAAAAMRRCLARPFARRSAPPRCRAAPNEAAASYKRAAAQHLIDKYVRNGCTVGLGSGELVNLAIDILGQAIASGKLENITAVPACDAAANEAAFCGVPLTTLEERPKIDVAFEEADQMDTARNAFVIGCKAEPQQPQLPRAYDIAVAASQYVVLVDAANLVPRLNCALPVAIDGEEWEETAENLDDIFLGDAEIWRRPSSGTANPRGGDDPYVSPEGHNLVDIKFYEGLKLYGEDAEYEKIADEIDDVPGVVGHGLMLGLATAAIVASDKGPQVIELKHTE